MGIAIGEDFLKNNSGMIRVTLDGLPSGFGTISSAHVDPGFTQSEDIEIFLTDARGTAVNTGVTGNELLSEDPLGSLTFGGIVASGATIDFVSDGVNPVIIYYDGRGANDTEVPLNGLIITIPEPSRVLLIAFGLGFMALRRRR